MQPCTVQKVQFPWTVTMYFSIHITVTLEILSAPSCMCIFFRFLCRPNCQGMSMKLVC